MRQKARNPVYTSVMLYSRAVNLLSAKDPAHTETLDKLLSALTKIEKLKALARSLPPAGGTPTTRHLVELSVARPKPLPSLPFLWPRDLDPLDTRSNLENG